MNVGGRYGWELRLGVKHLSRCRCSELAGLGKGAMTRRRYLYYLMMEEVLLERSSQMQRNPIPEIPFADADRQR